MVCAINPTVYNKVKDWASLYQTAIPFSHVIIDNFLDESLAEYLLQDFPDVSVMNRSHHYLFANKYELAIENTISTSFSEFYQEITSSRLQLFVSEIVGEDLFVDTELCGCLHQGINGSFLDMHTDFNLHLLKNNWLHSSNIIIYLNKDWKEEFGGNLLLKSELKGITSNIIPQFNRCIIMQSDDTTYHGYSQLKLPKGLTRKSIFVPIYKEELFDNLPQRHLTNFAIEQDSGLKFGFTKFYNSITKLKAQLEHQFIKKS
jgi:2OG-Fe(II) oxygenase superfamily